MGKRKLLFVFTFNQTIHWFIVGLIIPVVALFQMEKGLNLFQIGINMALYSAAVILFELPTGGLSDTLGRKKVYLISLAVNLSAGVVLVLAKNFFTLAGGIFLIGLGRALSTGSLDAWFVDEFNKIEPKGNLQSALATVGIFIPLGLALGTLSGGFIPMVFGEITSQIPGFGKYSSNLLVFNFFIIIQFFLTSLLIVEHLHPSRDVTIWSGFKKLPEVISSSIQYGIKNNVVFMLLLATLALGVGLAGLENFWQPQVKNILSSDSQTWIFGLLATGYFLASSLGSVLITPLCKLCKNNYSKILFVVRLLMGVFYLTLALQKSLTGFSIFYLSTFLFNGLTTSPHKTLLNAQLPKEKRSTLLSFESIFLQAGGLVGSLIMGYIAQNLSISIAWIVGAGILAFSCLLYFFLPVTSQEIKGLTAQSQK